MSVALIDFLKKETKDFTLFLCHTSFVSLCISIISEVFSTTYGTIFYLGFVNSIIMLYIFLVSLSGGLFNNIYNKIKIFMCKYWLGEKIFGLVDYIYARHITDIITQNNISSITKIICIDYIWPVLKFLFQMFKGINSLLGNNTKSKKFTKKVSKKYSGGKEYFANKYINYTFQNMMDSMPNTSIGYNKNTDLKQDMSFLSNTVLDEPDDLDDLDDNDEDLLTVPEVSKEQIQQAEVLEKEIQKDTKQINTANTKASYKKKMAEKKAARLSGKNSKLNQNPMNNMAELMNMPAMNEMFSELMKNDNLQKMMSSLPQDQLKKGVPKINPEQMKQIVKAMNKK